ncbi:acyl-CoA N-acyltransferase [Emericellopsis atlantica]|uniref:Acyl-CoA N-acyltransferase n=1 Tax=Emericellopsis atlantica TaxID=2614577 RepID=A0A9P7ZSP8_9HYPO|nr:acyl-CoA N-acyltransferase [Emericellopsis atlantica]KAG9257618.1 acyl-CoA N-acyltransferase [Emericellopsis atlantica]
MAAHDSPFTIRTHRPGDMCMIAHRFSAEFCAPPWNYDERFEALLGRSIADFLDHFHPARDRCWIAERDGVFMGCVALVQDRDDVRAAKLRLLFTDDKARGTGVGTALLNVLVAFATEAVYESVSLWTQAALLGARRLYQRAGFEVVETEEHDLWGPKIMGEIWRLELKDAGPN